MSRYELVVCNLDHVEDRARFPRWRRWHGSFERAYLEGRAFYAKLASAGLSPEVYGAAVFGPDDKGVGVGVPLGGKEDDA